MAGKQEQQGTLDARERLARISHHFLSDAQARIADSRATVRMTVPIDPDTPYDLPVDELGRALGLRGRVVNIVDLAAGLVSLIRPVPAPERLAGQMQSPEGSSEPAAAIRGLETGDDADTLIVVTQRIEPQLPACESVLLPVPCDPEGMYRAYCRAKTLAGRARPPTLGVIITGAADRASAESGFDKFARACVRFLGVAPISYAYLTATTTTDQRIAQLANIAGLLTEDWQAGERTTHAPDGSALN